MSYSAFQFSRPLLTKSHFEMNSPKDEINNEVSVHLNRNITKIEGENKAIVELGVELNQRNGVVKENALFVAQVVMQSVFSWDDSLQEEQVTTFLEYNASALLLSYIRPIVSTITAPSPTGQYDIPFINMVELFKSAQTQ